VDNKRKKFGKGPVVSLSDEGSFRFGIWGGGRKDLLGGKLLREGIGIEHEGRTGGGGPYIKQEYLLSKNGVL